MALPAWLASRVQVPTADEGEDRAVVPAEVQIVERCPTVNVTVRPDEAVAVGGVGGAADGGRARRGRGEGDGLVALGDGEGLLDLGAAL